MQVDFEPITSAPKWICARTDFLSGPNGVGHAISAAARANFAGDTNGAAKAFLSQYRALFGHGPEILGNATVKREFITAHNGMRTVVWEEQAGGITIFEAVLIAHTTKHEELVNLSSQFIPDPAGAAERDVPNWRAVVAAPPISATKAVAAAAANIGEQVAEADVTPEPQTGEASPEQRQRFKAPGLNGTAEARLVWLPMSRDRLRLSWEVTLTSRARGEMFRVLVDAQNGEAMLRRSLTQYISDASYRVFTSDSPSPFSPGYATPVTNQPPLVARTLVTLPALDTNASPAGWINDGGNETLGNNVDAHTDRNNDNGPDLPRPQGSPFRVFDFPMDLTTQDPTNYSPAAVVNLFYVCNWMHDKLYELGFTEAAGNFQSNNFGRGGLGNDALQADAQDGGGFNNANMSTPSDGSPPRMQMYLWSGPTPHRDGDLDAEIILHEYTHGLSNRRVGGGIGISALQSEGMGEGWSDWYAMTLLSEAGDDVTGNYAAGAYSSLLLGPTALQNYYFGIRRYPYTTDMTKNPLTFKDIDPAQAHYCASGAPYNTGFFGSCSTGNASEVHNQGEVWCVTLWEARVSLINRFGWAVGNQLILRLVTDGMNLSPANPNFLQARDAIIQADLVDTGGANQTNLWAAFAKRGMGFSAASPGSSTTTGVREAFDLPDDLRISPITGFVSSGPVGGPFLPSSKTFILTNAGSNTLTWSLVNTSAWLTVSPTSGSLTPGGPATSVSATVNNSANNLPMGIYPSTVSFTNLSDLVGQIRQFALRIGQPDSFTELFDQTTNDLSFQTFTFTPDGSTSFYSVCRTPAANYPTDPTNGTVVTLSDDSFVQVTLADTNTVSLYGRQTNVFFIGSNGYLTFTSGDTSATESFTTHFNQPRISGLFHDLNPAAGGRVSWKQLADRVAVTYAGVPNYNSTLTNNFQIEMFADGRLRLTYLSIKGPFNLVGLSAGLGVPANFAESDFSTYDACLPPLNLVFPVSATEGDGVLTNAGQVQLSAPAATNVAVALFSTDLSEVTVPTNITILAGQTNALFDLNVPDDAELDGTQTPIITASATGFLTGRRTIAIFDNETAVLHLTLPPTATEGQGTVQGTVQVSAVVAANVAVSLSSSDTTEIQVPSPVFIPAGQTSAVFTATVVNDTLIDGLQTATVTAHVQNWTDATATITVFDNENLNLIVALPGSVSENAGVLTNAGQVRLSGSLPTNLVVSLVSGVTNRLTVPASVIVVAGQTNALFNLTLIDNSLQDGNRSVGVTASAPGFTNGTGFTFVLDDETPPVITTQPANQTVLSGGTATFRVVVTGGQPLIYQWRKEGVDIAAATNSSYSIVNAQTNDAARYSVFITNIYGSSLSSNATLAVLDGTAVVEYFTDNNPSATGMDPPILRAGFFPLRIGDISTQNFSGLRILCLNEYNNLGLSGALLARLPDIQSWVTNGGRLIIHDRSAGNVSPNPFLLGVTGSVTVRLTTSDLDVIPPPTNLVVAGPFGMITNTTLDGGASSAHGYVLRTNLPPASLPILSVGGFSNEVATFSYPLGLGTVYYSAIPLDCYLTNAGCGANVIAAALQNIYAPNVLTYAASLIPCSNCPPRIVAQPIGLSVRQWTNVAFNVTASGTQPLIYQWRKDGTNLTDGGRISGATTSTLLISSALEVDSGQYSVLVTNAFGSALSSNAALIVTALDHFGWSPISSAQITNVPFAVTIQARDSSNGVVASFTGTVALSGLAGPNSAPISPTVSGNFVQGVWTGTVSIASLATNLVLRADDGAGHSGQSNPFNVTAPTQPPGIISQPLSAAALTGINVAFNVTANGTLPLSYQWRKNGNNIADSTKFSGVTTPSLMISNIANKDGGTYSVLVTNLYGSAFSADATLTVLRGQSSTGAVTSIRLELQTSQGQLWLLWPADPSFILESSSDLSSGAWSPVSYIPTQVGDQYTLPISVSSPRRFYRLR